MLIDSGNILAMKAWCFAIEYAPTVLERSAEKKMSTTMLQRLKERERWSDNVDTCITQKNGNATYNDSLTKLFGTLFKKQREQWRRVARGPANKRRCRMSITYPSYEAPSRVRRYERPDQEFYLEREKIWLGKVCYSC